MVGTGRGSKSSDRRLVRAWIRDSDQCLGRARKRATPSTGSKKAQGRIGRWGAATRPTATDSITDQHPEAERRGGASSRSRRTSRERSRGGSGGRMMRSSDATARGDGTVSGHLGGRKPAPRLPEDRSRGAHRKVCDTRPVGRSRREARARARGGDPMNARAEVLRCNIFR